MATINLKEKTIQIKIVYYGPGRSGKTSNLEFIHNWLRESNRQQTSKLISIDTKGDRTLFFDFFPISIGKISGFDLKLQLYTTPGQVKYESTRRLVLKAVDGVVFVADSLASRHEANKQSFDNLKENLEYHHIPINSIKIVFQWNKRDLDPKLIHLTPVENMNKDLNSELQTETFISSAVTGLNVLKTVRFIAKETVKKVIDQTVLQ